MPIPTSIADLSPVAASNSPSGADSPVDGDNFIRALSAIVRQGYDTQAGGIYVINGGNVTSYATLQAAVSAIGSTRCTIVVQADFTMTASVTVPSTATLRIENGARITTTSYTLTARIDADATQHFSGTGAVNLLSGSGPNIVPQWFGAVADGVADDTSAINSTLSALPSTGGTVFLPQGEYKFSGITFPNKYGIHFVGAGRYATKLTYSGTGTAIAFTTQTAYLLRSFTLSDGNAGTIGINLSDQYMSEVSDLYITGFTKGIVLSRGTIGSYWNVIRQNLIDGCTHGIHFLDSGDPAQQANQIWISHNRIFAPTTVGILCDSGVAVNCMLVGNDIESTASLPNYIKWEGDKTTIEGNWLDSQNAGNVAIYLRGSRNFLRSNTYAGTFAATKIDLGSSSNEVYEPDQGIYYSNLPYYAMGDRFGVGIVNSNPSYPLDVQKTLGGYSAVFQPGIDANCNVMVSAGNSASGREAAVIFAQNKAEKFSIFKTSDDKLRFYNVTAGVSVLDLTTKPTITGSRGGNAALASLLTALAAMNLITDSTTA